MDKVYLQFISFYLPEQVLTNEDLTKIFPEWTSEKIKKKTGIEKRHVAATNETALDLAEKAANKLFEENSISRESVDYIILCTQSPDYYLPTSACILQERLKLDEHCGAFDYNLGYSGYVYGLGIAKGLIMSGQANNVLLVTAETYSKYLHPEDKSCRTIFGDGAAASIVSSQKYDSGLIAEICNFTYRTIGNHFQSLIVENGCSRSPFNPNCPDVRDGEGGFIRNSNHLFMDGKDIFDFSAHAVPEVIEENLHNNNLKKEEIDLFVFHQANAYMLNFMKMRTKLSTEKVVIDLEEFGNTVSSTIPIALSRRMKIYPLETGNKVMLCGFGVGLSVGATVLKIN